MGTIFISFYVKFIILIQYIYNVDFRVHSSDVRQALEVCDCFQAVCSTNIPEEIFDSNIHDWKTYYQERGEE